jgi:regulator of sigma E protease
VVQQVGEMLARIFSGHASMKEVGGPVMIGKVMGQSAQVGWFPFLTLLALVSINLGLLNLLPFPVLDGGHLAFLLVEAIRRRPVPLRVQAAVQQLGFVLLILLMVYITFQDILKLKGSG